MSISAAAPAPRAAHLPTGVTAPWSVSPVRMRTARSSGTTKILPSPTSPVRAPSQSASIVGSTNVVGDGDLEADLLREPHLHGRAAVGLDPVELAAVALHAAHREPAHLGAVERLQHVVRLLRPDDADHEFHNSPLSRTADWSPASAGAARAYPLGKLDCGARPSRRAGSGPSLQSLARWQLVSAGGGASRPLRAGTSSRSRSSSSPRVVAVAGGIGASWALNVYNSAPPLSSLKPVQKGRSSAIYAADGSLIGFIRSDNIRQPVPARAAAADAQGRDGRDRGQELLRPRRARPRGHRPRRLEGPAGRRQAGPGRLDDHPAAGPQPLHPEPRRDDQAKADRSPPRRRDSRKPTPRTGSSPHTSTPPPTGRSKGRPRSAPRRRRRPTSASRPRTST